MVVVLSSKIVPDPSSLLLADPGQESLLDRSVLVPSLVWSNKLIPSTDHINFLIYVTIDIDLI